MFVPEKVSQHVLQGLSRQTHEYIKVSNISRQGTKFAKVAKLLFENFALTWIILVILMFIMKYSNNNMNTIPLPFAKMSAVSPAFLYTNILSLPTKGYSSANLSESLS
jgi:hypothetical protein